MSSKKRIFMPTNQGKRISLPSLLPSLLIVVLVAMMSDVALSLPSAQQKKDLKEHCVKSGVMKKLIAEKKSGCPNSLKKIKPGDRNPQPLICLLQNNKHKAMTPQCSKAATALYESIPSLFFSEVMSFVPCALCWYQRIAMYPLVLILLIALIKGDRGVYQYALPLTGLGWFWAMYHNLLHWDIIPESIAPCVQGIPCSTVYINWLGFITIPSRRAQFLPYKSTEVQASHYDARPTLAA